MKESNIQFFKIVDKCNDDTIIVYGHCINNLWSLICEKYFSSNEAFRRFRKDPYSSIYETDIKYYIKELDPNLYESLKKRYPIIENNDVVIYLSTVYDCFNGLLTKDLFKIYGFERIDTEYERNYMTEIIQSKDYSKWEKYVDVKNKDVKYKLTFKEYLTNNGAHWCLHIDNETCQSVGMVDIDTIKQFNLTMEIFHLDFSL